MVAWLSVLPSAGIRVPLHLQGCVPDLSVGFNAKLTDVKCMFSFHFFLSHC